MKASLLSSIIVALQAVLGLACVGCSQRPPVQTADIDFGAPTPRPRRIEKYEQAESQRSEEPAAREKEASPLSKEPTPDATAATEKAAEGSGGRAGDEAGGETAGGGAGDSGPARSAVGKAQPAGGDRASEAPPAFPGRAARRPAQSAADAEAAAKRCVNLARAAVRRGDADTACREALAAYEIAAAHAEGNPECAALMQDAERLLDAVGRRQPVRDVPTQFE